MSFPGQQAMVTELDQRLNTLIRLHAESLAAAARPKSERPAGLSKTIFDEFSALITFLDRSSVQLNRLIKLQDAYVDQLMEVKQLAWIDARPWRRRIGHGVERHVGPAAPGGAVGLLQPNLARMEQAWETMLQMAAGLPLPASFNNAVDVAKREFLGPNTPGCGRSCSRRSSPARSPA